MDTENLNKTLRAGDYIRYLSLFAVEMSNSGHAGLPLGCADIGVVLFREIMRFNPEDPHWLNRDRFILSAGHGSILLYSLLHCAGFPITIEDLSRFRKLGSKTPGHPERDMALGIETTTGPLGQGIANAIGIALQEKMLEARFNEEDFPLFSYTVYALAGDGCNMEGISQEATSLAGHLGLDNLIVIYDSNDITIDGSTGLCFTDDVGKRYESQGWFVEKTISSDLNDFIEKIKNLKKKKGKPKLLIVKTTIGEGLNKLKGSNKIHGRPAGIEEIAFFIQSSKIRPLFEEKFGKEAVQNTASLMEICKKYITERKYPVESKEDVEFIQESLSKRKKEYEKWKNLFDKYKKNEKDKFEELKKYIEGKIPQTLVDSLLNYREDKADETRNISGRVLNVCAREMPQIIGGSADLAESTKGFINNSNYVERKDFYGRNIHYGVREHAMGGIGNGLALDNLFIPFSSTFLVFSDYMRPAIRLSAIMKLKHLFVFTHDSITVGEDGPTHQPVEHINSLRLIPDLLIFRPANAIEMAFSYLYFLMIHQGPAAIICSRAKISEEVSKIDGDREKLFEDFKKGALIIYETSPGNTPHIILGASGTEVGIALNCARMIEKETNKNVRVLSIPCLELFNKSPEGYKKKLLENDNIPFAFIEASSHRAVNTFYKENILLMDIERFGISGKASEVVAELGLEPDSIYKKIDALYEVKNKRRLSISF